MQFYGTKEAIKDTHVTK